MKKTFKVHALILLTWAALFPSDSKAEEPESELIGKLRPVLQAKFDKLPEVQVNPADQQGSFTTVDLSGTLTEINRGKYYAFRFQTLADDGDLIWALKAPKGLKQWYIFAEQGRMRGFSTFSRRKLVEDVEGLGKSGDMFVLQTLNFQKLKPSTGYIMWFEIQEGGDPKVTLSLNILGKDTIGAYPKLFPKIQPEQE